MNIYELDSVFSDIKVGIILGFTGPIESLTPDMASGAELAFKEATDSGELLGGANIIPLRADSTCVDSAAATTAAEDLVSQGIIAIMGADPDLIRNPHGVPIKTAYRRAINHGLCAIGARYDSDRVYRVNSFHL